MKGGASRLVILGATGPTGRQILVRSLGAGHRVTALVRRPDKLTERDPQFTLVVGDATDRPAVAEAIRGHDLVISALGRGQSLRSHDLMTRCMQSIVPAMESEGVRRLILMSAFGVGALYGDASPVMRLVFRTLLRDIYADKARSEEIVRRSSLDWTLVCPVVLTNGPSTGRYWAGEHRRMPTRARISRADVAEFLVTQVEDPTHLHKAVVVGPALP
jgi:putative NADH-flavin reductase